MKNTRKWLKIFTLLFALIFVLAACGDSDDTTDEPDTETAETEETTAEEPAEEAEAEAEAEESSEAAEASGDGTYYERALAGEFAGTTVVVDGPFVDEDEVKFFATLAAFQEATGITIEYIGDKEFETRVAINIDAGNPPDIADFPQPGLLANFVRDGKVVDVNDFLSADQLQGQYLQSWLDMSTMEGPDGSMSAGVWWRFNGKSLVWYPKQPWDAAGYEIPTTWDELITLQDQIVSDGDSPWCIGIESGTATGWAATDWMEEFMLRTTSLENYDAWVTGTLPFASPEVKNAAERMSEIWFNDDYVYGGTASIVSTNFGDAPAPMFEDPPKCWLHKQGSFITSFFPEGSEANVDYGVFYLPPVDDAFGKPFLVAGDIMAMFNDRPEVRALMEYFTLGESLEEWLAVGGAFSPHKDVNLDWYSIALERSIAELVAGATSVRFDASDLMPGEVGAGSFWKGMTDYVSGAADLDTALSEIDASWPAGVSGESGPSDEEPADESMDEGGALAAAMNGDYAGTTVSVFGPFVEVDEAKFYDSIASFEEATGIDIEYLGTKEFETTISIRVDAGDAPDIADFPQPGLLANFAGQGKIVDVNSFLSNEQLSESYIQSWLDMASMTGPDGEDIMAGVWHRVSAKSFVWYPKAQFDAAGYEVPETWDDMVALTQQIADDGDTAWCIGMESGTATGWVATDWMENIMLRTTSLENYDAWVAGELPFASPEVKNAAEVMSEIWLNEDYVYGGTDSIATTFIGDSPVSMFTDPPSCWFHAQAPWIVDFFGEGLEANVDYDFFYMPPLDEAYGKPVLVAGDMMAMFNDRPEVRAVMEYFTKGEAIESWVKAGGAFSPHLDSSVDWYTNDTDRKIAQIILDATSVRFDASDLMPGEVGAGSFWKGMTDYVSGLADLDTALSEIDESWPR